MLAPIFLAGFTGHRAGYNEPVVSEALTNILRELQSAAVRSHGRLELYSSLAEGTDLLCVQTARNLGLAVHLLLPLEESSFAEDFANAAEWKQAQAELTRSRVRPGRDSVHLVSGEPTRPECYFNQGIQMLASVDVLIAVWDDQPARGLGGTAQIVRQAEATGIPVVHIHPATGVITKPESFPTIFPTDPLISELNHIAVKNNLECAEGAADPNLLQACLDQIAMAEAARFRPSLVRIILLHGIAALLAAIVTFPVLKSHWFDQSRWILTATELVLVVSALLMGIAIHRRHTQQTWIRCRFACELVRGLRANVPLLDPLHPPIALHDPTWKRFALSAGLLVQEHQPTHDPVALRDNYIVTRLSDTHPEGQVRHYLTKRPAAIRWWKFTGLVGTWSARLAPVFVLWSLLNKFSYRLGPGHAWNHDKEFPWWIAVVFLPIALPLLAGTAGGLRQALDAGRRKDRYPQMVARLTEIKAALPGLQTPSTIRIAITRSEEILLDELLEWQLAVKNTGAH